jgi:hypothetical protein
MVVVLTAFVSIVNHLAIVIIIVIFVAVVGTARVFFIVLSLRLSLVDSSGLILLGAASTSSLL